MRSALALAPTISVTRGEAIRLLAFVSLVYAAAVRAPGPVAFAAGAALGMSSGVLFSAFYMIVIAASGGIAAATIAANRRASVAGSLLFLGLAVAVGVRHVATGGNEAGFRVLKVAVFLLASISGSILGLRGTTSSIQETAK